MILKILETYDLMSQKYFIQATPTLFHSGTHLPQMLSCFLMGIDDSVHGIYKSVSDCAKISKWAGGLGLHAHDIRCKNSSIRSTNGKSNGIVPMLRVFNETARHVNQSGKRNGSFAIYIEPWHGDIIEFIDAKLNHGDENARARDLFYALWIPDLFMQRVEADGEWSLMCPDKAKNLTSKYGDDFNKLYSEYEQQSTYVIKKIKARDLWKKILISQIETGTPYMLYKDAANKKSNQNNLGTIKSSNLCTEIIEYSDHSQYACCTLASIGLPAHVIKYDFKNIKLITLFGKDECKFCKYSKAYLDNNKIDYEYFDITEEQNNTIFHNYFSNQDLPNTVPQIFIRDIENNDKYIGGFNDLITYFKPKFDFNKLYKTTKVIANNLNKIIDVNYYPVPETRYSNKLHRPIGIGVQGLADVYSLLRVAFDSPEAHQINKEIFATIYYASMKASMEISRDRSSGMKEIIECREKYVQNYQFTCANEFILEKDDIYIWKTGNQNNNLDNNHIELSNLEKQYLPIDEELYTRGNDNNINGLRNDKYLGAYSSFEGSPLSKGQFQFDLWNEEPLKEVPGILFDWDLLREDILKHGVRNSLLVAPMPTASTSQILSNTECIEPITSNIYSRNTMAGSFIIVNKYLLQDLISIGLWNDTLKNNIISNSGSIQDISIIPDIIKELYKTSWDISQKTLINQSAERGIYVCQSQSLNLFLKNPDFDVLSSMHLYSWKKGLKTGMYYLRTKAVARAQQFTIEPNSCESCSA